MPYEDCESLYALREKVVGLDHFGVSAQDDLHRSYKDIKRMLPCLPSFAA
jgi:hypothetical protein